MFYMEIIISLENLYNVWGYWRFQGLKTIHDDLHLHLLYKQTGVYFWIVISFMIFRYKLLLESLLNKTPRDHPDFDKLQGNM